MVKKYFQNSLVLLLFSVSLNGWAQKISFEKWNNPVYDSANTAEHTSYLSENEKEVIRYVNLARMNGKLFAETYLKEYLASGKVKDKWTSSLKKELENLNPLPPLQYSEDLYEIAKQHAEDMGKSGKTGHRSSTGVSPAQRYMALDKTYTGMGENCWYGKEVVPVNIVIDLLVDRNVSSLGHRKAILSKDYYFIGTSIMPHKYFGNNCVQSFAGRKW